MIQPSRHTLLQDSARISRVQREKRCNTVISPQNKNKIDSVQNLIRGQNSNLRGKQSSSRTSFTKRAILDGYLSVASQEDRQLKAQRHFRDAYYRRVPRTDIDLLNSKFLLKLYEISVHPYWHSWMNLLTTLYLVEVFLEPTNKDDHDPLDQNTLIYLECQDSTILFFYLIDTLFSLFEGSQNEQIINSDVNFFKEIKIFFQKINYTFLTKAIMVTLFIADEITFYSGIVIMFSRILRPFWYIYHSREVKHILFSIFLSFHHVIDTIIFFIVLCLFWAFLGYNLLSDFTNTPGFENYSFYFQDYFTSFISIYTLLSMDNYPRIFLYIIKDSNWYLIYFLPFVIINLFFLLPMPTTIIFTAFKQERAKLVLQDKISVSEAMVSCFLCYDKDNSGKITVDEYFQLVDSTFYGRAYRSVTDQIFNLVDIDGDGVITMEQFIETYELQEFMPRFYDISPILWSNIRNLLNGKFKVHQIADSNVWNIFILIVVFVNTVIVIYNFSVSISDSLSNTIENLDNFFISVYILDVILKIIAHGIEDYFAEPWYQFDFFMVIISIMTMIGLSYLQFLKKAKSAKLLKIVKAQKALRMIRTLRTIRLLQFVSYGADTILRIKKLFVKVSICFPLLFKMLITLMYLLYIYAMIGIQVFNINTNTYRRGSPYIENQYTHFTSVDGALLALLTVCTQSGWTDLIYDYGYKFDEVSASLYFCSFHLLSVIFLMSLLQGLLWETFYVVEKAFKNSYEEIPEEQNNSYEKKLTAANSNVVQGSPGREKFTLPNKNTIFKEMMNEKKFDYIKSNSNEDVPLYNAINKIHIEDTKSGEKNSQKDIKMNKPRLRMIQQEACQADNSPSYPQKKKSFLKVLNSRAASSQQVDMAMDVSIYQNNYNFQEEKLSFLKNTFSLLELQANKTLIQLTNNENSLLKLCEIGQIEQIDALKDQIGMLNDLKGIFNPNNEKELNHRIKIKQNVKQKLTVNTQNALLHHTYLNHYNQEKIDQLEKNYISTLYGKIYQDIVEEYSFGSALNIQNGLLMMLKRIMRYSKVDINYFSENLFLIEKQTSLRVLPEGSFIKFLFQFEQRWFFIKKNNSTNQGFYLEELNQEGFWNYSDIFKHKQELYFSMDFNQKSVDRLQSVQELVDNTFQCFKYMSQEISDFMDVNLKVQGSQDIFCFNLDNNFMEDTMFNLLTIVDDLNQEGSRNSSKVSRLHSIHKSDVAGKVFILLVNKTNNELIKNNELLQKQNSIENHMEEFVEKNIPFIFNSTENNQGRLPLSATIEFIKDIRDILIMYSYNLFFKISQMKIISKIKEDKQIIEIQSENSHSLSSPKPQSSIHDL